MRADPIDMNIGIDNVAAMYELTEMVIRRGYQNIGLLCANGEQWIFQQHLQGWYKAMLRHHLSPNRVINAAMPPSFDRRGTAARVLAGVAGAGCAGVRIRRAGLRRAVSVSVDALKCRTIWLSWALAIAT